MKANLERYRWLFCLLKPEILLLCTWGICYDFLCSSWIFRRKYQFTFSVYMAGVLRGPLRYDWHDNCRAQTLNEAALSPSIIILALKFRAVGAWVGGRVDWANLSPHMSHWLRLKWYTVRPWDARFFGKEKNSCNFCYLIGWRQDDRKSDLLKVFTS